MVFPPPTPALRKLLLALCAAYIVSMLAIRGGLGVWVTQLDLQPNLVLGGQIWRLVSYGLLHDGIGHLIGNLLLLYFFGMDIERQFGAAQLWRIVVLCTVGGGVLVVASATIGLASSAPVIGASGGALGLLVTWCMIHARRTISLFGLLPLTGQQLLFLAVGLEILMAVTPSGSSSAAHLGGMAMGWLLITNNWRPKRLRQKFQLARLRRQMKRRKQPKLSVLKGGDEDKWIN